MKPRVTLHNLKEAVDQAIERCHGSPVADFKMLINGKPFSADIRVTHNHEKGETRVHLDLFQEDEE